jgi:hypothetical protein
MPEPAAVSPNGHRAERDGCGCPPWAKQCVHFEGRIVCLHDEQVAANLHKPGCPRREYGQNPYAITTGGSIEPYGCGCELDGCWDPDTLSHWPDLPDAEAEFHRREEELRAVDA